MRRFLTACDCRSCDVCTAALYQSSASNISAIPSITISYIGSVVVIVTATDSIGISNTSTSLTVSVAAITVEDILNAHGLSPHPSGAPTYDDAAGHSGMALENKGCLRNDSVLCGVNSQGNLGPERFRESSKLLR